MGSLSLPKRIGAWHLAKNESSHHLTGSWQFHRISHENGHDRIEEVFWRVGKHLLLEIQKIEVDKRYFADVNQHTYFIYYSKSAFEYHANLKTNIFLGRGGGQVVSMLALYSDDLSSNPAEVLDFSVELCLKRTKINKKEAGVGPFFKKQIIFVEKLILIIFPITAFKI